MTRRPVVYLWAGVLVVGLGAVLLAGHHEAEDRSGRYDIRATAIEACSCPLFCSCYYNPEPTDGHKCEFNMAYKFEEGSHYGDVDLSGALLWLSGDLGDHFGDMETEWAIVTHDKRTTPEQREAIGFWINTVFPVKWAGGVTGAEDEITWTDGEKVAHAKLASGDAEITLTKVFDAHGKQAAAVNTNYFGAHTNEGFLLAHATHYRKGAREYHYEGRNGFMVTNRISGSIE